MKIAVTIGLLCLIGLALSSPANERPVQRRRPVAQESLRRAGVRRPAPVQRYPQYDDEEEVEEEEGDSEVAASDSYGSSDAGGAYDDTHAQFEKGIQNQADSYSSDKGVDNGRIEFAIHGQQGPHTYRFGYDTGHGPDRKFRFEERDAYGVVNGRYGYYDQTGKFRIVNYSAHPEHGFKAEGDFGPK